MHDQPEPARPRIAIVGGVAGGASAATRARRTNEHAEITLFEKDSHVSFANCGLPYYLGGEIRDRDRLLVATPELFRDRFAIDVRTRHEVLRIDRAAKTLHVRDRDRDTVYRHAYDKLILAPGASPLVPPLDGADAPNVFTLRNLDDADRIHAHLDAAQPRAALVIGAGFIGLEMVEQLVARGLRATLVEKADQVLPPLDPELARLVQRELEARGVAVRLGDQAAELLRDAGRVTAARLAGGDRVEADLVVIGIGVRPNVALARDAGIALGPAGGIAVDAFMRTSDPDVYAVGDAAEYRYGPTGAPARVPLAGPANRAGRLAGEHAATGHAHPMGDVFGTAIVRVFGVTAGLTGLSEKAAVRARFHAAAVTVRANHHAGYYPGARPLTLKLVYDQASARVLGAQAVGAEGVDKRIDIVATAMRFGATVDQLAELDLAYAPPFGAAKDPIHLAAFAATNAMDRLVRLLPAAADLDGLQVVDVRTPAEAAAAPLREASPVNIPIDTLRRRLGELDPAAPTVAVCASGQRSYNAARVLAQRGFHNVASLDGGQTMREVALADGRAAAPAGGVP